MTPDAAGGVPGSTPAPAPGASVPAVGAPAGGPAPAPRAPGRVGTGFISFDQYLNANRGAAEGMAQGIAGDISTQGQLAQGQIAQIEAEGARNASPTFSGVNPTLFNEAQTNATEASTAADLAQTGGGQMALLGKKYGTPGGYTANLRGFDAALMGAAGGDALQKVGQQFGDLDSYLSDASSKYQPSPAPGPGPKNMGPAGMSGPGLKFDQGPAGPASGGGGGGWEDDRRRRQR